MVLNKNEERVKTYADGIAFKMLLKEKDIVISDDFTENVYKIKLSINIIKKKNSNKIL